MSNIVIPDGGNIGSASDPDAISIPANGKPTFSAGIANTGTIDAGTIGTGVTINAGTNVSGINQLIGISHRQSSPGAGTVVTVEKNKTYIGIYHGFASVTKPVKIIRFSVDGSGNVGTPTTIASWSATLDIQSGTNTVNAYTASGYEYLRLMIFEEGQTIDTA